MIPDLNIPDRWKWATFDEVAEVMSDLVDPTLTPTTIHIAPNHIESWTGKILPFATVQEDGVTSAKNRFSTGQILYSKIRPYLAKVALAPFDGVCSADMYPVKAHIDTRYLLHWLLTPWFTGETSRNQGRTILPKINRSALGRLSVPVAPFNEQKRIGEAIEELFSELDAGVTALKRVRANLKRYRSAVLKAAVEGRLTEAWRVEHQPQETGSQLLARILKERRNKWEADQLASFAAAGKTPPKGWQAKYKEPAAPDTSDLPPLPKRWCWASADQLCEQITDGEHNQPKYQECGMPMLTATHVRNGSVVFDRVGKIAQEDFDKARKRCAPKTGDVLVVCVGATTGRAGIVGSDCDFALVRSVLLLKPLIPGEFILHWIDSPWCQQWIKKASGASAQAHFYINDAKKMVVPLPPLCETLSIASLLKQQLDSYSHALVMVEDGITRANRLRQSILKQAFEGKLVPQDPTDEPASVLLARIRQQRAAPPATSSSPPSKPKPKKVSKDVFVRRAAIVSYIVSRLASRRSFGRTQLEKTLHLAQSHIGLDLQFAFERYKAGPFDKDIYKIEGVAKKQGWFTKDEPANGKVTYHPGNKIEPMCKSAIRQLADKRAAFDGLLDHIAGMNTDDAELFATAYAAWNDLLIDGRTADDAAIVAEVHGWDASKKKFTQPMIVARLNWMRSEGYIPCGSGEHTMPRSNKAKSPKLRRR